MNKILGGQEDCEKEDIPSFLTPDADRGVKYSDELIEMKGKLTLHMAQDPPHIMYANDTFVHNTGTQWSKLQSIQISLYQLLYSNSPVQMLIVSSSPHC